MKTKILTFFLTFTIGGLFFNISAQETARERIQQRRQGEAKTTAIGPNVRAEQMNRHQGENIDDAKWMRVVYRYLDLSKEANAPLYYPVTPDQGRMNLFSMIFRLMQNNSISAYEYLDGREVFAADFKVDFKEFLDRFSVYYTSDNGQIEVGDVDIPSNEVQGYFIKEAYYFETGTSNYGVKTLAICPVIHRMGDYDATSTRYPLFWIPYDEIRPYALRMPIMTSSLNNTMTGTIDDFFRKHTYEGEIYKTANPRNLAISQYASTPEEIKVEQDKIERQLLDFEKNLWQDTDTIPPAKQQSNRRIFRKSSAKTTSGSSGNSMRDRRY